MCKKNYFTIFTTPTKLLTKRNTITKIHFHDINTDNPSAIHSKTLSHAQTPSKNIQKSPD